MYDWKLPECLADSVNNAHILCRPLDRHVDLVFSYSVVK